MKITNIETHRFTDVQDAETLMNILRSLKATRETETTIIDSMEVTCQNKNPQYVEKGLMLYGDEIHDGNDEFLGYFPIEIDIQTATIIEL